jgi:hypothetical protein
MDKTLHKHQILVQEPEVTNNHLIEAAKKQSLVKHCPLYEKVETFILK